eukprot:CAMPEP_0116881796 /NCGR_PEP_ID=MMETSP0463-20121206/13849_1 /TAXON_ID=181622 /ORGANISM="Strombidinopsis sp, Strain SopsisLIS2011" /LENGTH=71 /DNA_ID=CAMNT_0004533981 /DNA_START=1859 /DNA_END=2074 /DNA_ORIENTATION=+
MTDDYDEFEEHKKKIARAIFKFANDHSETLKELWTDLPDFNQPKIIEEPGLLRVAANWTKITHLDLSYLNI